MIVRSPESQRPLLLGSVTFIEDESCSHGDGDEEHVETLENHVATVTDPDVLDEDHDVEGRRAEGRERAEGQLAPLRPVHLAKAHAVSRCRA